MKGSISHKPVYIFAGLFFSMFMIAGGIVFIAKTNPLARQQMLSSPLVQHFKHTYNSIKKLPDLLFVPYILIPNKLPTYSISISLDNIIRMNGALPDDPLNGHLLEANKQYVKAQFTDPESGYSERVDIKYRGLSANHWNALQKSYRVQFDEGKYWNGMRLVNFVTPYDRMYYVEPLNMYRAGKFGLMKVDMRFVRLNINGEDTGVYLAFEQWSPEFLAKKGLPESKMFGESGVTNDPSQISKYENMFDATDTRKEELATLLDLRDNADDATLRKLLPQILDMDKLYSWNILTILSGSTHQTELSNAVLYFNSAVGKFELVPWDTELADVLRYPYTDIQSFLIQRVMSIPEFRAERDRRLNAYLADPANLADDLAFYDKLVAETKTDFFKDTSKFHSDFGYLSLVDRNRQWIINAYTQAKDTSTAYTYPQYTPTKELAFSGTFSHFGELARTTDEFLAWNPHFYKIDTHTVGLSGTQAFYANVTVPPGTKLVIAPGTRLYLDAGVSLFVHGSLEAVGTQGEPITIGRLNPNKAWGTVAVINADAPSILAFVTAEGGSGTTENGINITGMLAFHNSDVTITHSAFSHSSDDDAINTKSSLTHITHSIITNSFSDGIDIDYAKEGSEISSNMFSDIGTDGNGDAIDLSWSAISIRGNKVKGCNDKGVSVGERSTPDIENNSFSECAIGIAVKDLSDAYITGNTFSKNRTAISLYKKKDIFGGGYARVGKNIFEDSEEEVSADSFSKITYVNE